MAKGDHKRMQNEIATQGSNLQYGYGYTPPTYERRGISTISRGKGNVVNPGTPGLGGIENLYRNITSTGPNSYDEIMNNYRNFLGRDSGARSAFSSMASDGSVNADAIRNRAMSGVRSVYANAKRNVDRNRAIQGGYSPGYDTLMGRMAREQGQNLADASTDVEAKIAELVSRNKLAGASGLAGLEGMDLSTLGAMNSAREGQVSNLMNYQQIANQIAQMMLGSRAQNAQIPGDFSQAMGNINNILGLGGRIAGSMIGLGGANPASYVGNDIGGVAGSIYR